MTIDIWITIAIIALAVILFITEWLSVDLIGLLLISLFAITGVLTPAEAVKGFSNSATVTIAAMFALSAALIKTGQLTAIGHYLSMVLEKNRTLGILLIMAITGIISAFVNNTPVVAVFIPIILSASARANVSPSKLLIPLSFASMFGGVCTLIGTSTNILVSSIAEENGVEAFGMFEMTPLGLIFFVTGILYLILFGRKLIPDRGPAKDLTNKFVLGPYLVDIRLLPNAVSVGKTVAESPLTSKLDIELITLKQSDGTYMGVSASNILRAGDVLRVKASIEQVKKIQQQEGVEIIQGKWKNEDLNNKDISLAEVMITPSSELNRKTISPMSFKNKYQAIVLAVRGRDGLGDDKFSELTLKPGDVLLLRIKNDFLQNLKDANGLNENPFLILSETDELKPVNKKKVFTVVGILALVVGLTSLKILPIVASSIIGVTLLVMFRSLTMEGVYKAINWQVIFMIAGAISIGTAMESSGAANLMSKYLIDIFRSWGPIALLTVFYLIGFVLTELISNSATAVLLTPIAISAAHTMGVDPRPFLFAIAFAASASFLTPVGYQTNTMIYSVGNYKYKDFFRVGLPLNLMFWIIATLLIPLFYHF